MNWGKKLVVGMALFMAFIVTLGTMMIMRNGDDSLVEQNYYEKGQNYNTDFEKKQRAQDDQMTPKVATSNAGVNIIFPAPVSYQLICRRPSDAHMDQRLSGSTAEDGRIDIPQGVLRPGPWSLRIEYTVNGNQYLFEEEIVVP